MKLNFLITSLTSCSGCISSLMASDIFPQFFERTKLNYFPFISDEKNIQECDIAFIEGCISNEEDILKAKKVRKYAKKVYALGTCAAYGGILGLSEEKDSEPLNNYIEIDGIIPGCPPPLKYLGNTLIRLIENKELETPKRNLCAECPLRGNVETQFNMKITRFMPNPAEFMTQEESSECFLKKGMLCLGPITREGCEHRCIELGLPCEGCMGPISKDYTSNVINFLSLLNLSKNLENYRGIFYRFFKPKFKENKK